MSWEVRTMQSKTSYFNAMLFRKNLTRFWPLWGLASFIGALFPLAVLLDMVHRGWNVLSAPDFTGMYYDAVSAVPVINLVYAALCAMAVWSYLYNARSVGLMHTLPIRREGLFLTNFLSGLSMTLIPYAVTGVLCVVVSLCGGAFDAKGLAVTVLAVLGESFFYFSSATFVAFITGNAFAMPPLYALLHFLAVLLDWLISSFAQGFIFGFSTYYTGVVEWLSPTVYLVNNVRCARQYVEVQQTFPDGTPYTSRLLTSADLESFWLIGVYALVGLALAALALILYRRRRSETAGDVVAVSWVRPIFKYGVAFCTAVSLGQFLYYFLFGQYRSSGSDSLPGTILCMAAAGLVGYFAAEMLIKKSFRVFRAGAKGAAIVALALVLLGVAMSFDLTGYEKHVPDESEIESVYYTFSGMTNVTTDDADTIRRLTAAHQAIVKNRNEQARIADAWDADTLSQSDHDDIEHFSLRLTYYLKDGSQLSRSYSLYLRRSDLTVPSSVTARVNALYMCRESVLRRVLSYGYAHLGDTPRFLDSYCYYYDENSNTKDYALTAAQAEQVYAALMQDVQDSDNGGSDIFAVQEDQYDPPISFWLEHRETVSRVA